MTRRTKGMYSSQRESKAAVTELVAVADALKDAIADALKEGTLKEGSKAHLEAKRELKKCQDSINLNRRRTP